MANAFLVNSNVVLLLFSMLHECTLQIAGTLRQQGFLGKAGATNEYRLCGGGFKLRSWSSEILLLLFLAPFGLLDALK